MERTAITPRGVGPEEGAIVSPSVSSQGAASDSVSLVDLLERFELVDLHAVLSQQLFGMCVCVPLSFSPPPPPLSNCLKHNIVGCGGR